MRHGRWNVGQVSGSNTRGQECKTVATFVSCRERQEKAENKAIVAAENNWRNLLRSIFTRIKVQGDYSAAAADASGERGPSHAPLSHLHSQSCWWLQTCNASVRHNC